MRVAGCVKYLEAEPRRFQPVSEGGGLRWRRHAPDHTTIKLRVCFRPGQARESAGMGQQRDAKFLAQQPVAAAVVFVVVGGDAAADGQLAAQARYRAGQVGRPGIHQ